MKRRTAKPFGYNEIFGMYFISAQHRNQRLKRGLPPNPPDEIGVHLPKHHLELSLTKFLQSTFIVML